MKATVYVSVLILFSAFLIYFIPVLISPTGTDVQNAINLRNEVELIVKNSGHMVGDETNIVMMKPQKNKLMVVVKNAYPSIDSICNVIEQNKHFLGSEELTIIFKDRMMNQVEIRRVNTQ